MAGYQESGLCALRFTRLKDNGYPIYAADTGHATAAWAACDPVNLELSFEYDTGTDTTQKTGCGALCFTRKRGDSLKNATVNFEICGSDPRQMELILGAGASYIGGSTPTGFALEAGSCSTATRNGVFIEWWTETWNCNALGAVHYVRHFLPRVIANYNGGTWDEGRHSYAFTGQANSAPLQASGADGGPFGDIEGFSAYPVAYLYGFQSKAATENQLPECSEPLDTAVDPFIDTAIGS